MGERGCTFGQSRTEPKRLWEALLKLLQKRPALGGGLEGGVHEELHRMLWCRRCAHQHRAESSELLQLLRPRNGLRLWKPHRDGEIPRADPLGKLQCRTRTLLRQGEDEQARVHGNRHLQRASCAKLR
jgi:hypothetical protein